MDSLSLHGSILALTLFSSFISLLMRVSKHRRMQTSCVGEECVAGAAAVTFGLFAAAVGSLLLLGACVRVFPGVVSFLCCFSFSRTRVLSFRVVPEKTTACYLHSRAHTSRRPKCEFRPFFPFAFFLRLDQFTLLAFASFFLALTSSFSFSLLFLSSRLPVFLSSCLPLFLSSSLLSFPLSPRRTSHDRRATRLEGSHLLCLCGDRDFRCNRPRLLGTHDK